MQLNIWILVIYSTIISSDCTLFGDQVENANTWNSSLFDAKETEIRRIFNQTGTISIFLTQSQDSEHVMRCLSGILNNDSKAWVVNNLSNESVKSFSKNFTAGREYYGFIIFTTLDKLNDNMLLFINPIGSFLFVIEALEFNIEKVLKKFNEVWKKKRSFKVFVMLNNEIYCYKPFDIVDDDSNGRGKLMIFTENYELEMFKDLKGYNLNVEVFASAYSILDDENLQFTGPDAEVTNLIQEEMNFTSKVFFPDSKSDIK